MVFHRRQIKSQINQDVYLRGHDISRVSSVKLLGLLIDEHLSWAGHTEYLFKVLSKFMLALRKIKSQHTDRSLF